MSFWLYSNKDDHVAGIDLSPLLFALLPAALSLLAALLLFQGPWVKASILLSLLLVGFAMFFAAKVSVIRRGRLVSFGTAGMTPAMKVAYRLGYAIMGAGALLIVAKLLRRLVP